MAALLAVVRRVEPGDRRRHGAIRRKAMDADLASTIAEEVLAVLRPIDAQNAFFRPPKGCRMVCPPFVRVADDLPEARGRRFGSLGVPGQVTC